MCSKTFNNREFSMSPSVPLFFIALIIPDISYIPHLFIWLQWELSYYSLDGLEWASKSRLAISPFTGKFAAGTDRITRKQSN